LEDDDLAGDPDLYRAVAEDLDRAGARGGLSPLERLAAVALVAGDRWTEQNGCLTAAGKLQRRAVHRRCSEALRAVKAKGIF
jgi:long-chain acyl-CoA synthetase